MGAGPPGSAAARSRRSRRCRRSRRRPPSGRPRRRPRSAAVVTSGARIAAGIMRMRPTSPTATAPPLRKAYTASATTKIHSPVIERAQPARSRRRPRWRTTRRRATTAPPRRSPNTDMSARAWHGSPARRKDEGVEVERSVWEARTMGQRDVVGTHGCNLAPGVRGHAVRRSGRHSRASTSYPPRRRTTSTRWPRRNGERPGSGPARGPPRGHPARV